MNASLQLPNDLPLLCFVNEENEKYITTISCNFQAEIKELVPCPCWLSFMVGHAILLSF